MRNEKTLLILTIMYVRIIIKLSDLLNTVYSPSSLKHNTLGTGLRPLQGWKTKFLAY